MAAVYTIDAGSGNVVEGGIWTSASPPPGTKWVLRNLDVLVDNSLADASIQLPEVFIYNSLIFQVVLRCEPVWGGQKAQFHWEGRSVITEGEVFISSGFPYEGSVNAVAFQLTLP